MSQYGKRQCEVQRLPEPLVGFVGTSRVGKGGAEAYDRVGVPAGTRRPQVGGLGVAVDGLFGGGGGQCGIAGPYCPEGGGGGRRGVEDDHRRPMASDVAGDGWLLCPAVFEDHGHLPVDRSAAEERHLRADGVLDEGVREGQLTRLAFVDEARQESLVHGVDQRRTPEPGRGGGESNRELTTDHRSGVEEVQ
jgi:hypothetical protein